MTGAGRADIQALADATVGLCRDFYQTDEPIELYRPAFDASDETAIAQVLSSGWVAMGGYRVREFEQLIAKRVGRREGLATIHATAALELGLRALGVQAGDGVITQANTFIAPANAISYLSATPFFIDVDKDTLGMSPKALSAFLETECERQSDRLYHRLTGQRMAACLPVHALGLPARIHELIAVCERHQIPVLEDAAEALGSGWMIDDVFHPCGGFGQASVVSFNANKIMTTGSGGMLLSNDVDWLDSIRHLAKIAKIPHACETAFDAVGYNFAMPNLNAALGLSQFQKLDRMLEAKQLLDNRYQALVRDMDGVSMLQAPPESQSNHWIHALLFEEPEEAQHFIEQTRSAGVLTRPLWTPLHRLAPYQDAPRTALPNTEWLASRVVQLPSAPG